MASLNKIILIGNLGRDPEIKAFQNGDKIANFSMATSEKWTDKATQEKKEVTQWHRIVVRNQNIIRTIEMFVKKGTAVIVEGKLTYRKYKSPLDSSEKVSTEIVVGPYEGNLTLLPGNGDTPKQEDTFQEIKKDDELDDEIPF